MKIQCPNCLNLQDIPEHYENQRVKCLHCKKTFTATKEKQSNLNSSQAQQLAQPATGKTNKLKLPYTGFMRFFADLGVIFSIICIIGGFWPDFHYISGSSELEKLFGEQNDTICIVGGFIWLFLSLILHGVSSVVDAINTNTESKK